MAVILIQLQVDRDQKAFQKGGNTANILLMYRHRTAFR